MSPTSYQTAPPRRRKGNGGLVRPLPGTGAVASDRFSSRSRQAQINRAEGEKQSEILQAEGQRQSEILKAEGDQQAQVLRASGFSEALDQINQVANKVDGRTMSLQYFDTLKSLGDSPSTKWIFPMEFTNMLAPFLGMASGNQGNNSDNGNSSDGDPT